MAKIIAVLACRHQVQIDHRKKEPETYCRYNGIQQITERWETEWRAVCLTCQWSRWTGSGEYANGEKNANREANSHVYWHRGGGRDHAVHVFEDSRIKPTTKKILLKRLTLPVDPVLLDLFETEQPPPF